MGCYNMTTVRKIVGSMVVIAGNLDPVAAIKNGIPVENLNALCEEISYIP